ncbi:MAG: gliding motility-associated C-terminal domain-containing protein, partial [Chitinophagaceae bacterium]|nr:gliding motility-associated C-terminal domain-containing protein [Chitinophagaceae bacterium]
NDTAIVRGQPLQLHATGADFFTWEPETGLSRTSIPDPVSVLDEDITYILRSFTSEGCFDYDTINIKVFKTAPDIFVPNAFVPNGINNELRPKPVGIAKLDYFRVFNRYGQMVFQTAELEKGWNGRINGELQNNGAYVWMASGTDYTGRKVIRRGTAVLIR